MSDPSARTFFQKGTGPAARVTAYVPKESARAPVRAGRWWEDTHEVTRLTIGHKQMLSITRGEASAVSATADQWSWTMTLPIRRLSINHLLLAYRAPASIDGVLVPGGWKLQIGRRSGNPANPTWMDPTNPIWMRFWGDPDWRRYGEKDLVSLHDPLLAIVLPYAPSKHPSAILTIETTRTPAVPSVTRAGHDEAGTPHTSEGEAFGLLPPKQRNAVIAAFADGLAWPPPPPKPANGAPMGMRIPRWTDLPDRISENWRAAQRSKKYGTLVGPHPHAGDLPLLIQQGLLTYGRVYAALTVTEPGESYREDGDSPQFIAPHLENVPFLCQFQ